MKPNSNPSPEPLGTDGLLHTFAASLTLLLLGLVLLLSATNLGRSFTTESQRRDQVGRFPVAVPNFLTVNTKGDQIPLRQHLAGDGRVMIVDFVYTRCQSLCSSLASIYQQLQADIVARGLSNQVGLLSISFDPLNDQPQALATYAARLGMQPQVWQILSLTSTQDRRALLGAFGIMVIPAPLGEFEHNAALHLVTSRGDLVRIMDYASPNLALSAALALKP